MRKDIIEAISTIKELIKTHEDFLLDNPEIMGSITERFAKAVAPEEEDDFDEDEFQEEEVPEEEFEEEPAPKPSRSSRQWAPLPYSDAEKAKIKQHTDDGFSTREAVDLAGVSPHHNNLDVHKKSRTLPDNPSERMHGLLRDYHRRELMPKLYEDKTFNADPTKNPTNHATGVRDKGDRILSEMKGDLKSQIEEVENDSGLSRKERRLKINELEDQFHSDNPEYASARSEHAENLHGTENENKQLREDALNEQRINILMGGAGEGEIDMVSEGSRRMAGQEEGTTAAGALQSVGGERGEEDAPANVSVESDPHTKLAQRSPEYVKQLREHLKSKLSPEQIARHQKVDGIKGNE